MGAGTAASGAPDDASVEPLPWPVLDPWPAGWLGDTPAEAVLVLRRLTIRRRLATAHALWRSARAAVATGERLRDPRATSATIDARVRARFGAIPDAR